MSLDEQSFEVTIGGIACSSGVARMGVEGELSYWHGDVTFRDPQVFVNMRAPVESAKQGSRILVT